MLLIEELGAWNGCLRLWVFVLIELHAANLGAGCLERLFSVVGCRLWGVGCEFSVVGFSADWIAYC
jgi:hypothetical protein